MNIYNYQEINTFSNYGNHCSCPYLYLLSPGQSFHLQQIPPNHPILLSPKEYTKLPDPHPRIACILFSHLYSKPRQSENTTKTDNLVKSYYLATGKTFTWPLQQHACGKLFTSESSYLFNINANICIRRKLRIQ